MLTLIYFIMCNNLLELFGKAKPALSKKERCAHNIVTKISVFGFYIYVCINADKYVVQIENCN